MFLGLNPMQFDQFAGRYYLGAKQKLYLDLSESQIRIGREVLVQLELTNVNLLQAFGKQAIL